MAFSQRNEIKLTPFEERLKKIGKALDAIQKNIGFSKIKLEDKELALSLEDKELALPYVNLYINLVEDYEEQIKNLKSQKKEFNHLEPLFEKEFDSLSDRAKKLAKQSAIRETLADFRNKVIVKNFDTNSIEYQARFKRSLSKDNSDLDFTYLDVIQKIQTALDATTISLTPDQIAKILNNLKDLQRNYEALSTEYSQFTNLSSEVVAKVDEILNELTVNEKKLKEEIAVIDKEMQAIIDDLNSLEEKYNRRIAELEKRKKENKSPKVGEEVSEFAKAEKKVKALNEKYNSIQSANSVSRNNNLVTPTLLSDKYREKLEEIKRYIEKTSSDLHLSGGGTSLKGYKENGKDKKLLSSKTGAKIYQSINSLLANSTITEKDYIEFSNQITDYMTKNKKLEEKYGWSLWSFGQYEVGARDRETVQFHQTIKNMIEGKDNLPVFTPKKRLIEQLAEFEKNLTFYKKMLQRIEGYKLPLIKDSPTIAAFHAYFEELLKSNQEMINTIKEKLNKQLDVTEEMLELQRLNKQFETDFSEKIKEYDKEIVSANKSSAEQQSPEENIPSRLTRP